MAEEPLSREAAVGLLMAQPQEPQDIEIQAEPDPADAELQPAEEAGEGDGAGDAEAAEAEPIAAPKYWDAQDKAWFDGLSPDQQAVIARQEEKRENVVARSKAQAAEARAAADAELQHLRAFMTPLQQLLPQAVEDFRARWGEPDWSKAVEQHGAEETLKLQAQYAAERRQVEALAKANAQAQAIAAHDFVRQESARLAEMAPDLAQSQEKKSELAGYLLENGATPADLAAIPAWAAALAFDGMKYRKGRAEMQAQAAKPKAAARPGIRPSGQPASSQQRSVDALSSRLAKSGSREDAVALILAKGL